MSDGIEDIYTGASDFGKFTATLGGLFGTIIGLLIVGIGIYFIVEGSKRTKSIKGNITKSSCNPKFDLPIIVFPGSNEEELQSKNTNDGTGSFCDITVDWVGKNDQTCTSEFTVENTKEFDIGNQITVYFDPSDPCNTGSLDSQRDSKTIGLIMIVVGVIFLLLVWLSVYLVYRFKFLAASSGVGSAISIIEDL